LAFGLNLRPKKPATRSLETKLFKNSKEGTNWVSSRDRIWKRGGKEGRRKREREGGRKEEREGGRKEGREGGRKEGRERGPLWLRSRKSQMRKTGIPSLRPSKTWWTLGTILSPVGSHWKILNSDYDSKPFS
jgi:hypothetical protein